MMNQRQSRCSFAYQIAFLSLCLRLRVEVVRVLEGIGHGFDGPRRPALLFVIAF